MSGDAGNKSRRAKRERERASSFSRRLGLTTHRLERTGERVSVRLALRAVQDSVREDAHGRRSRQQVVVPQHHLRLRVHRVHARFGVFLDSVPSAISRKVGTRTRPDPSRRGVRRAREKHVGRRVRRDKRFLLRRPVRECRPKNARPSLSSRCSFAAFFGETNEKTLRFAWLSTRVGESDKRVSRAEGWARGRIAGFRGRSHRAEALDTTRAEARVVARPPRWVRALGRTAGAAVEAAAAATSRAKATWLRES
jgi:hypothetical protein